MRNRSEPTENEGGEVLFSGAHASRGEKKIVRARSLAKHRFHAVGIVGKNAEVRHVRTPGAKLRRETVTVGVVEFPFAERPARLAHFVARREDGGANDSFDGEFGITERSGQTHVRGGDAFAPAKRGVARAKFLALVTHIGAGLDGVARKTDAPGHLLDLFKGNDRVEFLGNEAARHDVKGRPRRNFVRAGVAGERFAGDREFQRSFSRELFPAEGITVHGAVGVGGDVDGRKKVTGERSAERLVERNGFRLRPVGRKERENAGERLGEACRFNAERIGHERSSSEEELDPIILACVESEADTKRKEVPVQNAVTLLIYAGGRATRMGGINKALVPFLGRPMVEWVRERLAKGVSQVLLSANRDHETFEGMGFVVCADTMDEYPGPLAGLLAVKERGLLKTPWLLTAPCDAPMVPETLLETLWTAAEEDGFGHSAYTVVAEGYPQNAFALIRSEALSGIRPFLLSGERKLGAWLKGVGQKKVFMRNYRGNFKNLNAFEEISSAEAEEISKNFQKDP